MQVLYLYGLRPLERWRCRKFSALSLIAASSVPPVLQALPNRVQAKFQWLWPMYGHYCVNGFGRLVEPITKSGTDLDRVQARSHSGCWEASQVCCQWVKSKPSRSGSRSLALSRTDLRLGSETMLVLPDPDDARSALSLSKVLLEAFRLDVALQKPLYLMRTTHIPAHFLLPDRTLTLDLRRSVNRFIRQIRMTCI